MKTKELIKRLNEEDPSGELECCINNADIHFVERMEAYWDGALQVLKRDENCKFFNIIGGKYTDKGFKVKLHYLSISDLLSDRPNAEIDFSELSDSRRERYKESIEKTRKKVKDLNEELELETFTDHVTKRAIEFISDLDLIKNTAKIFYEANLNYDIPIPKDIPILNESYNSRRNKQWDREIDISFDGLDLIIKREINQ